MTITRAATEFDPALRKTSLVVALGAIMTVLDTTIVNVAVTVLGRDLHSSLATIQWVITGYTLALSMTIPITGWAVERFGAKTMWITSLVLFVGGSVLCGMAWSAGSLIAFRLVQGVGGGLLMPIGQTMLARAAGPARMGRAMAVIAIPAMLAPALGPVLGGLLLDHLAWRWMFYVNVPVCAAALLLAARLLPPDGERATAGRLDTLGLALLSPGLAALVYGLAQAGEGAGPGDARVVWGVAGGLALLAAFVVHSLRSGDRALVNVRLFADRAFGTSAGALLFYSVGMFGMLILVPLYDQVVRGGGTLDAGLLVAPLGVGAILTMPVAGRVTDRYGPKAPGIAGIACVLAGTFAFTLAGASTSLPFLAAALFVVGLGHGLIVPSLTAGAYSGLLPAAIPSATTAATIVIRVASALGSAVLAIVLQILIRSGVPGSGGTLAGAAGHPGALADAFAGSFRWAFALLALCLIPALFVPRRPAVTP
ncbi:MDR family MFS transporter [Microbispora sp. NPDC049125]|uniref:MDR family MFS transporter n=1 Tax=Microbispora sp. NPDC049125 TaxID=3154929 RepID=UPI003465B553